MSVHGIPLLADDLLTGMVQEFPYDPRVYPMVPYFPEQAYETDMLTWDVVTGGRGMAHFVDMDGEAHVIVRDPVKQRYATPAHMKEKSSLSNSEVSLLRAAGATGEPGTAGNPELAERAVTRILRKLTARNRERRNWMCTQALRAGAISYSGDGPNFSLSYGLGTLTAAGTAWTDADATIIEDLHLALEEYRDANGYAADVIFASRKIIRNYFLKNTFIDGKISAAPNLATALLAGDQRVFELFGLAGIRWIWVDGQYENDAGSVVDSWGHQSLTLGNLSVDNGEPPLQWGRLLNEENMRQNGPHARSWQETGDSKAIWALVYDNGIPIIREPGRFRTLALE